MSRAAVKKKGWQPLERCVDPDPTKYEQHGLTVPDAVYRNDRYSVFVRNMGNDALHISFHRHDRAAVRDWRHCQAIKNEVAGMERLAIEIFPPESALVDSSNEYHLWVLPRQAQEQFPFMLDAGNTRFVLGPDELEAHLGGPTKARQRRWERGIPTGKGIES